MTEPKDYAIQVPNSFIDNHLRNLTPYELPVLLVIMRKTRGSLQEKAIITDKEMYDLTGLPRRGMELGINLLSDYWKMIETKVFPNGDIEYQLISMTPPPGARK